MRLAYAHRVPLNTFWRRSKTIRWKTWKNDEKLSWEHGNLQSRGVMRRLGHPQLSSGDHTVTHRYRGGILAQNCKALFYCALQLGGKKTSLEITFPCSQRRTLRQVETRCCSDEHERAASLLGMLFTNPESPGWQLRWNHEKSWNFEMYLDGTMLYNVIPGVIPLREMASVSKEKPW